MDRTMDKDANDGIKELTVCPDRAEGGSAVGELPVTESAAADCAALKADEQSEAYEPSEKTEEQSEGGELPSEDYEPSGETEEDLGTFGDKVIDNVSLENNLETMCRRTKLPEAVARYIMGVVYIALGIVCAAIPRLIESVLPYVVGGIMGTFAIVRFVYAIIEKEYKRTNSNRTASSLIMLGVSIMIIIEHEWAQSFIPTVWGVWGLFEGAHAFNHVFARIAEHKRFFYFLVKGIAEVVVAFLLLYEPHQYGELHIIVFGISLIIDGVVALPFVHKFVTRG
ncbi:MAG: HdeD family acid-resistance protein [Candidatus Coproplasma sp.]